MLCLGISEVYCVMNQRENIIHKRVINKRDAVFTEFPSALLSQIADFLLHSGIQKLYTHQAEMFDAALNGKNIVITTSTASGKTLSFLLPVLQEILKNPLTRAIIIYPTKALASDQYKAMHPIIEYFGKNKIYVGIYDGDTPVNKRREIRNSANIILNFRSNKQPIVP